VRVYVIDYFNICFSYLLLILVQLFKRTWLELMSQTGGENEQKCWEQAGAGKITC
jgi:hypothetical protein